MTHLRVALDHLLREPISDQLWRLGQEQLANRLNVIMESGHWTTDEPDEKWRMARDLGVTVELPYLDVPIDELHRRIAQRKPSGPGVPTRWNQKS